MRHQILLIEESGGDIASIRSLLEAEEVDVAVVASVDAAAVHVQGHSVDVVILAVGPDGHLQGLDLLKRSCPDLPVVVLTGAYPTVPHLTGNEEKLGEAAVLRGAGEYLSKGDMTGVSLARSVSQLTRRSRAEVALRSVRSKLESARVVQEHLFPGPPQEQAVDLWAAVDAPDISGDFYDFLHLPDGRLVLALGDVTGHGFDAALLMASARAYLRALAECLEDFQLPEVMAILNGLLTRDVGEERFVALTLACVAADTRALSYCAAGQPPGVQLRGNGELVELTGPVGLPLGIEATAEYEERLYPLASGDLILLATDGLTELSAPTGEAYGEQSVLCSLRRHQRLPARDIVEGILADARLFAGTASSLRDDITVLVARFP